MHKQKLDCLEMIAQVAQESYGLFTEAPKEVDEKSLKLWKLADWKKNLKDTFDKLQS